MKKLSQFSDEGKSTRIESDRAGCQAISNDRVGQSVSCMGQALEVVVLAIHGVEDDLSIEEVQLACSQSGIS